MPNLSLDEIANSNFSTLDLVKSDDLNMFRDGRENLSSLDPNRINNPLFLNQQNPDNSNKFKPTSFPSNKRVINKTQITNIIGLPPKAFNLGKDLTACDKATLNRLINSMIIVALRPAQQKMGGLEGGSGLSLFTLDLNKGMEKYTNIIKELSEFGINPLINSSNNELYVSVINDISISESITNEFSESMFEGVLDMGGSIAREVRGITGATSNDIGKIASSFGSGLKTQMTNLLGEGTVNTMMGGMDSVLQNLQKIGNNAMNATGTNNAVHAATNAAANAAEKYKGTTSGLVSAITGAKVDFPMIWQGSSYSPSYQFTTRLYNPYPEDQDSYVKYILNPLAHILAFAVPISESSFTFSYPLLCQMDCPGLCSIDAGYFADVSIVKGGESNDISFAQRPGTVDVRFTVAPLYSTLVTKGDTDQMAEERPTLKTYMETMSGYTNFEVSDILIESNSWHQNSVDKNKGINNAYKIDTHIGLKTVDSNLNSNTYRNSILEMIESNDPFITKYNSNNASNSFDLSSYKDAVTNFTDSSTDYNLVKPEVKVAYQMAMGYNVKEEVQDWYWQNIDLFPDSTDLINITSNLSPEYTTTTISTILIADSSNIVSYENSF